MGGQSMIVALSQAIARDTATVEDHFIAQGIPSPSFDIDSPQDFRIPSDGPVLEAYERVIDNTSKLNLLMLGPSRAVQRFGYLDAMSTQAVLNLKIAQYISDHGPSTFEEVAEFTGINRNVIRRILRFAMTNWVFCEDPPGTIKHSSLSRRLGEDAVVQGAVGMLVNECFPGSAKVRHPRRIDREAQQRLIDLQAIEPLLRNGDTKDPLQCGWALANNAQAPLYEELNRMSPERAQPVMDAMTHLANISPVDGLLSDYPWAELGQATVVDIGGGRGPVSIALASRFPNLRCIVQDLELTARSGADALNVGLADRVSFMPHNFFHEQSVKHADVYFLRHILHDWPEEYGIKILQALVPAFKVGSRVVIHEFAIPKRGTVSDATYKFHRSVDMNMMVYFNGQERELSEWEPLIAKIHPRLKFARAYHPRVTGKERLNTTLAIVEAVWTET